MIPQPSSNGQEDRRQIFEQIRAMNRIGREWNLEEATNLADAYGLQAPLVDSWGKMIYKQFESEHDAVNGPPIKRIEAYLSGKYYFRRNALSRKVMVRPASTRVDFQACHYNDIWRDVQHQLKNLGIKGRISLGEIQTLLESDYVKEYHPIKDYFEHLAPWDGRDHIQQLADHVHTEDQQFWSTQFKKALVRMIACSYEGVENRIVMTLFTKEQNRGKNRFIKFLVPLKLREYFKEDPLHPNKDSEIALTQNFVWHLDELEALDRNDMASLKSFISRSSSKQRLAYARQEETRMRIVNFWGSTNKEEFLTDWQNTRWLIFRVISIDWNYSNEETGVRNVDINQVWSQAWRLYKDKFNYRLDETDRSSQDKSNKSFETVSLEKQYIMKYLSPGVKGSFGVEFMQTTDILEYLQKAAGRINLNHYAIKPAMAQLDFVIEKQEVNKRVVPGWFVVKSLLINGSQIPLEVEAQKAEGPGMDLPF